MRTTLLATILVLLIMCGSGCATIMHGKYQDIPITSEPSGATVTASSGQKIITPGTMMFIRNKPVILRAELEGYEAAEQKLSPKMAGWFWGNILAGGIIGGAIDHSSGAGSDLVPHDVHFNLVPIKEEAEAIQKNQETKVLSKKEYEEYQRYLLEKENSESQDSKTEK